ncbi:MAG: type I methionyl aminopeptidase [Patescibacteria group bacterium]|jgi:methionyl aminopeptidase
MAVDLRTPEEIARMRRAGEILAGALDVVVHAVQPDATGVALDRLAETYIRDHGAEPAFKGYRGYPASLCISINEEVVHGIPSQRPIAPGDLVSVDLGVKLQGWHVDAARSLVVPPADSADSALVAAAWEAFYAGFGQIRPGVKLGDVQAAIQTVIERHGYGLVRDLTGHGIGRSLHEAPDIPNYGNRGTGLSLQAGMTFCIEPMLTRGSGDVRTEADDWTIIAADRTRAAHVEETVLVTPDGAELLTGSRQAVQTR